MIQASISAKLWAASSALAKAFLAGLLQRANLRQEARSSARRRMQLQTVRRAARAEQKLEARKEVGVGLSSKAGLPALHAPRSWSVEACRRGSPAMSARIHSASAGKRLSMRRCYQEAGGETKKAIAAKSLRTAYMSACEQQLSLKCRCASSFSQKQRQLAFAC